MIFTSVFFLTRACFRVFRISYYWAAKSSNHSKPICDYNQRVPWASPKRLKPLSRAPQKCVFSPPAPVDGSAFRRGGYFGVSRVSREEFKTTQSIFKRWRRIAKIKRRKMFDHRAFILFRTQSPHAHRSCSSNIQLFSSINSSRSVYYSLISS